MDNRTIDEVRKNEDKLINEIELLEQENKKYKEVINKAINKLGIYADKMTDNANAYAICVDLLDILKKGGTMKEEKETLKYGYWLDLILKLKNLKSHNAKDLKKVLLECVDILDKIIELESENEN